MKMKNVAAVAMAGCMAASLAACGGSASTAASTETSTAASTEAATSEATEATGDAAGFTVQLGPNPETLDPALNSSIDGANTIITTLEPLLLIDDLGTEPLMENITVTQLFNLLNERQNAKRHTVISTNLSVLELKARYTERITSRLLDETSCKLVKFIGEDIRTRTVKPPTANAATGGNA